MSHPNPVKRHDPVKRLIIAGGGTGGHLFPAIAAAEAWEEITGGEVLFVGAPGGLETRILPQQGRRLETLRVGRLKGGGTWSRLKTVAGLPGALAGAMAIVRKFRPLAILGVGGFASAPAVAAGRLLGLPTFLHEQNAKPGLTNRWLSRLAHEVFISLPQAADAFPDRATLLVGNPVRRELFLDPRPLQSRDPNHPLRLLVFGGSQGAQIFTNVVPPALAQVNAAGGAIRVRQQARVEELPRLESFYRQEGIVAQTQPFIHDMAEAYREADLVICRAGATTLAELAATGRPALMIPYPFAADDHQTDNARAMVDAGGGWMRNQSELNEAWLAEFLLERLADPQGMQNAAVAAHALARPDAARRIVERILELSTVGA